MEQIELRESLAELSQTDDPLASLNQIMLDIKNRITIVLDEQLDDKQKNSVKQLVHKMQFLNKLQQEAEYQEESLLDVI